MSIFDIFGNDSASSGGSTQKPQNNSSEPLIPEARDAAHQSYVKTYNELKEANEKSATKFDEERADILAKEASAETYVAKAKELEPKLKLQKELKETESELRAAERETQSAKQEMDRNSQAYFSTDESLKQQLASGKITQEDYKQQMAIIGKVQRESIDKFLAADAKRRQHELKKEKLEKELEKYDTDPRNIAWRKEKARKQRAAAGGAGQQKINNFKGTRTRLTDQAALIINFQKIAQQKHKIRVGTRQVKKKQIAITEDFSRFDIKYKNYSLARLGTTGHYAISSLVTKHSSMNVFFNKLPPQVLSFLIPTIKLYKVFYPFIEEELKKESNTSISPKTSFDWRVPFDDVPVRYFDQTSKNAPSTVDDILKGNGSLHSVGIKSFTYKYEGNNPATANTLLSAELKLYFENPEELIREYNFTGPNEKKYTFQYSDLVNQASKRITTGVKKNAPNENYYRIKVICGFTDINENIIRQILSSASYSDKQIESIIEAIKVSKATFYLSPYSYDLSFTENSSVELSIKYTAAVDAIMISEEADIFNSSDSSQQAIKARKAFELFIAAQKKAPDIKKNPESKICPEDIENEYLQMFLKDNKHSGLKNLEEQLRMRVFNTKKEAYKNIYRRLIGLDSSTNHLSGLYSAKIKTELINALTVVGGAKQRADAIIQNQGAIDITLINVKNIPSITKFIDELKYQVASNKGNSNSPTMDEQAKKRIDQIHKSNMANAGRGYSTIKFFFLGDIIDAALECFDNIENPYDRPRLILGEIPISIPTDWDDKGRVHKSTTIFANLADMPISFDFFMQFFVDKIIKTQRERYSAMEFIKDIISTLIIPSVSPSIFGIKESPNTRVKYSLLTFNVNTVIKDGKELDPFTNIPINENKTFLFYDDSEKLKKQIMVDSSTLKGHTVDINNADHIKKLTSTVKDTKNNPSVLTYLYVYCSSKFPNKFTGNELEDINYGVYHVRMGRDTGIIKKINFKKSDMPFQREFLARRQGSGKGTTIKQVYNADITMFGNNIYVPGDYIFIEPYYMTSKSGTFDLQADLGLGGYYMVLKVHNNITEASFETRLECIFQAPVAKDSNGNSKVDPIDEDACN